MVQRENRLDVRGAQALTKLKHNESESEEEYEEEEYEEENEEMFSSWQGVESLRIRREQRAEYFEMMEHLFVMSGDGIHSKNTALLSLFSCDRPFLLLLGLG